MSTIKRRIAARRARARALNDLYAAAHGTSRLDRADAR